MPARTHVTKGERTLYDTDHNIFLDCSAQHWAAYYRDAYVDIKVSEKLVEKVYRLYRAFSLLVQFTC